tara:strand:+ start:912 stop:1289 length:378 start_codon:yes stop_codon:yes gene_type:complete
MMSLLNNRENRVFTLDLLKEVGGDNDNFINDMLHVYIEESPKTIQKLKNAIVIWDIRSIKSMAHKLRSPLAMLNVLKAVELTEFIEFNASKIEKRREVEIAAEDLITLINIVINQVKEFLDLTKK